MDNLFNIPAFTVLCYLLLAWVGLILCIVVPLVTVVLLRIAIVQAGDLFQLLRELFSKQLAERDNYV